MAQILGKIMLVIGRLMGDIRALFQGGGIAPRCAGEPSTYESGEVRFGSM